MSFGSNTDMAWVAIVACLALFEYIWLGVRVGAARGRFGVSAPATTGNETFERLYRVQHNTIEQLVIFLPSLYLFGTYVDAKIGAGVGLVFIVGRLVYALAYVANPESRSLGFLLTFLANVTLLVGGMIGAVRLLM
jgi:uncharacterized MAPEG superfamily protein